MSCWTRSRFDTMGKGRCGSRRLRHWLERALRLGNEPFDSAQDAEAALAELQDDPERERRPRAGDAADRSEGSPGQGGPDAADVVGRTSSACARASA